MRSYLEGALYKFVMNEYRRQNVVINETEQISHYVNSTF